MWVLLILEDILFQTFSSSLLLGEHLPTQKEEDRAGREKLFLIRRRLTFYDVASLKVIERIPEKQSCVGESFLRNPCVASQLKISSPIISRRGWWWWYWLNK